MELHRIVCLNSYLNNAFRGKDVGLNFSQKHEAEIQCDVRLGSVHFQLFDGPTQHSLDAVVVSL